MPTWVTADRLNPRGPSGQNESRRRGRSSGFSRVIHVSRPFGSSVRRWGYPWLWGSPAAPGGNESFLVSEPEPQHPWNRHYAAGGGSRPPVSRVLRSGKTATPFDPPPHGLGADDVPEDGRLIGLPETPPPAARPPVAPPATANAGSGTPQKIVDWSAVPEVQLITATATEQVRVETEARRWQDAWKILRTLGLVVAAGIALVSGFELAQRVFNARPSESRLAAVGAGVAAELWREFDSPARPLRIDGTELRSVAVLDARRADYRLTVTLRLRAPLYGPADSNGAQGYLDLQRAVAQAHDRVIGERLYLDTPALATPPVLPPLIAQTHRAGERLVIELPVAATRALWGWRLEPELARRRVASPVFTGDILARQPAPHLVFGTTAAREPMRTAMREARDYVIAVQRAVSLRGRTVRFETPE